jgi:hypothetical protein
MERLKKKIVCTIKVPLRYEVGNAPREARSAISCTFGVPFVELTNPPVARLTPKYPVKRSL